MPIYLLCLCALIITADRNHDGILDVFADVELYDLQAIVRMLDVSVVLGQLPAGWWGAFHHPTRTVTMRHGLSTSVFRSVLAHELGHAHLGHSGYHPPNSLPERAADRFAAKHLIRMDDYHAAMAKHGNDPIAMAEELNVMPWVVKEFGCTTSGGLFSRVAMAVETLDSGHPPCFGTGVLEADDDEVLILGNNVLR